MNATENNKLIAEFMGCKPIFKDKKEYQMVTHENMCYSTNELQYHKDWNWLMEVVEKIEGLEIDKLSFNFKIEKDRVSFFYTHADEPKKQIKMFFEWGQKTKISNTYKVVVEFIKWYNEQN